jgi:O-antigen/teichoic acid export membrane protein
LKAKRLKTRHEITLKSDTTHAPSQLLTQSPLLAKNTLLNLLGYGAPAIAALFAIPLIVAATGTDRFGILTLAWVLIGYLSLLDLGLGRALTKLVAEKLGEGSTADIPSMIWTALSVMVLLSFVMGLFLGSLSGWIVNDVLKIPADLKQEARSALLLLALFLPVVVVSVGFRGILEAYQRFDMVNAVRIPLGILSFAAPLAVVSFTVKLPVIIFVLLIVRLLAAAVQFYFCYRIVAALISGFDIRLEIFGKLLRFGSWMTITNVINPLLFYMDRFLIGAFLTITAVAYYATPSEAITHLALVSAAFMSVMFPAFSTSFKVDRKRSALLLDQSLKYVFIAIFPIVFLLVGFASEGLRMWLNEEFAQSSFRVCQLIAVGVFFTCLGQMPYALIQGAGRPDLTGKLHLCELPIYLLLLVFAIRWGGINGAALLWAVRALVDMVCMYAMAQKLLASNKLKTLPKLAWMSAAIFFMTAFAMSPSLNLRIGGSAVILLLFAWIGIRYLISPEEVHFLKMAMNIIKENRKENRV